MLLSSKRGGEMTPPRSVAALLNGGFNICVIQNAAEDFIFARRVPLATAFISFGVYRQLRDTCVDCFTEGGNVGMFAAILISLLCIALPVGSLAWYTYYIWNRPISRCSSVGQFIMIITKLLYKHSDVLLYNLVVAYVCIECCLITGAMIGILSTDFKAAESANLGSLLTILTHLRNMLLQTDFVQLMIYDKGDSFLEYVMSGCGLLSVVSSLYSMRLQREKMQVFKSIMQLISSLVWSNTQLSAQVSFHRGRILRAMCNNNEYSK